MPFMTMSSDPKIPPPPSSGPAIDADLWYPTAREREAMPRDPDLIKLVNQVLSGRVPDDVVADMRQETLLAASRSGRLPADPERRNNYIAGIARNKASGYWRRQALTVEVDDEAEVEQLEPVAQAVAVDTVAERDLIAKLVESLPPEQQKTVDCMRRQAEGEELTDIAADVGVNYNTLYSRIATLQKLLREHAHQIGALVVLLMMGGLYIVVRPKPGMGWDMPEAVTLQPAVSTHVYETDPLDRARALRGQAFKACVANQWNECLGDLDAARSIDPDGDADPLVREARADAVKALASLRESKPGERGWTPTGVRPYAAWAAR